jgi:hypothetical protein
MLGKVGRAVGRETEVRRGLCCVAVNAVGALCGRGPTGGEQGGKRDRGAVWLVL